MKSLEVILDRLMICERRSNDDARDLGHAVFVLKEVIERERRGVFPETTPVEKRKRKCVDRNVYDCDLAFSFFFF